MRAIRTLPARYARHTHAERVCGLSGNGFCVQARQDRCSGRLERAVYSLTPRSRRALGYGRLVFMITS